MKADKNKEFYKMIFDHSLDAILLTSPDGRIHRANDSACKMFDMTEDEIINIGRNGLIDTNDSRLQEAIRYREQFGYVKAELTFLRRNQIPFPAIVTSSVFKDKKNNAWTVTIIRDLTEAKESEKTLIRAKADNEFLATHDYVTGVLNRRGFIKEVTDFIENNDDERTSGFLLLDIDYFKEINDTFGHIKGDYILKDFADFLSKNLDESALLGRYGGDEFIVFYSYITEEAIKQEAEKIRIKVSENQFLNYNQTTSLTVSIGVTLFQGYKNKTIDNLISIADRNMYRAKNKRNSIYYEIVE
jgi:diguanylate cyclase (GGDEF)-like protein/PAS domain S-box-containing protein